MFKQEKRQAIYNQLLDETLWVRGGATTSIECGHSLLFRPTSGILRRFLPERESVLIDHQRDMIEILGLSPMDCSVPVNDLTTIPMDRYRVALFEGYAVNPEAEGSVTDESMAQILGHQGLKIIRSSPNSWARWSNKGYFRDTVASLYGPSSVPSGVQWNCIPDLRTVSSAIEGTFAGGAEKVILKGPGAAGFGNMIISLTESRTATLEKLSLFLQKQGAADWMTLEEWIPWQISPCTSFFLDDSDTIPMEMCEQMLSLSSGGFVGSKSFGFLCMEDREALIEKLFPIAAFMRRNGLEGFIGIDTILSTVAGDNPAMRLPVSGLWVRFIEVNPRVNGHNQERLFCALLGRRTGVPSDDISHVRVGVDRPVMERYLGEPICRESAARVLRDIIGGHAQPFTGSLDEGKVYWMIDNCHSWPTMYDAVLLFGYQAESQIAGCLHMLRQAKLLRA